jgi:sugar phosphate isomerase/epimerase
MHLSVSTYIFAKHHLNAGHLAVIKNAGFDEIDLFALPGHFDWNDPTHVEHVQLGLKQLDMQCVCLHAPWDPKLTIDIASLDDERRAHSIAQVKTCVDILHALGGEILVAHPGSDLTSSERYEERIARAKESLLEIAEYARRKNVKLAIENPPPGELCHAENEILTFYRNLPTQTNIGFCFDTGHANTNPGGVAAVTQILLPCFIVHLSDNHGKGDDHLLPGQGSIAWPQFFSLLKRMSFDGICTLELGPVAAPSQAGTILAEMKNWLVGMLH